MSKKQNKQPKNLVKTVLGTAGVAAAVLIPLSIAPRQAMAALSILVSVSVELHFGTLTDTGAGGTAVINTAGARSVTGSVSGIAGAGLESNGVFNVSGSTGVAIDVSMTAPTFVVSNGGDNMNVNNFHLVTNAGGIHETITLGAGSNTYPLGATLNVGAAQAAGTYTGTYTLSVNYQ